MNKKLLFHIVVLTSLLAAANVQAQEFVRDNMLDRTVQSYKPACEAELATILETSLADCETSVKQSVQDCKVKVRATFPEVISVTELEQLVHRFVFCNMLTLSGMKFDIESVDRFRWVFEDHQRNGSYLQGSR